MRRFKQSAGDFYRGHTLIQDLGRDPSTLPNTHPLRQRLVTAWAALTATN
ncbi:MAG TPA: hypothetical protein VEZ12_11845 [Herpetosiphonaceae bacterium]|nr:hypothetical protein [Herpetosiphonaceae bacterium]